MKEAAVKGFATWKGSGHKSGITLRCTQHVGCYQLEGALLRVALVPTEPTNQKARCYPEDARPTLPLASRHTLDSAVFEVWAAAAHATA